MCGNHLKPVLLCPELKLSHKLTFLTTFDQIVFKKGNKCMSLTT